MDKIDFYNKIKEFEGFRAHAYKCPAGVWTIGYGRTSGVTSSSVTSRAAEEHWFQTYVNNLMKEVSQRMTDYGYDLTDYQLQALTSFAYNLGIGNKNKGLIQLVKSGERTIEEISKMIPTYNKGGGKVLNGLVNRRAWEKDLFDGKFEKAETKSNPTAKDLQELLNKVGGFNLAVDGKIGKKTITAAYTYISGGSQDE
jgi:lysozyme